MKNKIVINVRHGGFSLSQAALLRLRAEGADVRDSGPPSEPLCLDDQFPRHDPRLVKVVEEMGDRANSYISDLQVVEVGSMYLIHEYEGKETVEEPSRRDWVVIPA